EARAAVRDLKARGVDFIKVHDHTPREAFFAIADEAPKAGLSCAGHVPIGGDYATNSRRRACGRHRPWLSFKPFPTCSRANRWSMPNMRAIRCSSLRRATSRV